MTPSFFSVGALVPTVLHVLAGALAALACVALVAARRRGERRRQVERRVAAAADATHASPPVEGAPAAPAPTGEATAAGTPSYFSDESQLRAVLESAALGVAVADPTGTILDGNRRLCDLLGHRPEELRGRNLTALTHPDDVAADLERFEALVTGDVDHYDLDKRIARKGGGFVWVNMSLTLLRDGGGRPELIAATVKDVSLRKQAEVELHLLQRLTRRTSEAESVDVALRSVLEDLCTTCSWRYGEAWMPAADGASLVRGAAWHPDGTPIARVATDGAARGGGDPGKPGRVEIGTGFIGLAWSRKEPVWLRDAPPLPGSAEALASSQLGIEDGFAIPVITGEATVAVLAFYPPVAQAKDESAVHFALLVAGQIGALIARRQVEAALQESVASYRLLARNFPQGAVVMFDRELRYRVVDGAALAELGLSREQLEGRTVREAFAPETAEALEPSYREALSGTSRSYETAHAERVYQVQTLPVKNDAGEVLGGMVVTSDVTSRKRTEVRLRESEERYRRIVELAHDGVWVLDAAWRTMFVNRRMAEMLGEAEEALAGRSLFEFLDEDARAVVASERADGLLLPTAGVHDVRLRRKLARSGPDLWGIFSASAVSDEAGTPNGVFVMVADITERKLAEERLKTLAVELQRSNEELDSFASVASHDLQEPLRKIRAFGDRLQARCADQIGEEGRGYVQRMQGAAQRMQTLVDDVLAFARVTSRAQPFVRVDLEKLLREVVADLEVRLAETGGTVEVGSELPIVVADPTQMRQLFQNLLGNALKFHRPGEPPRIRVVARPITAQAMAAAAALAADEATRARAPAIGPEGVPESVAPASDPTLAGSGVPVPIAPRDGERTLPGAGGAGHEVRIEDNGIGFEDKYKDRIFGMFQRLHGRTEYEGTGVGLAICRKIVERHGGSITAHGDPGRGATFVFTMPGTRARGRRTTWTDDSSPIA